MLARLAILATLLCVAGIRPSDASGDLSGPHRLLTLVDYLVNDYPGAVDGGAVINTFEHEEHLSLAAEARLLARALPPPTLPAPDPDGDATAALPLPELLDRLHAAIVAVASPTEIATLGRYARQHLIRRYQLATFPRQSPDLERGRALFLHNCSACHGSDGSARTEIAARLEPPPRRFDDPELLPSLSPYRVFNGVSFGIRGTGMPSFGENVSERDRWDIAFWVLALRQPEPDADAARAFARAALPPDVSRLAITTDGELTEAAMRAGLDAPAAGLALAYARRVAPGLPPETPIALARRLVAAASAAVSQGRHDEAGHHALDAYLHGVEPAEGLLRGVDPVLTARIETDFVRLRESIRAREPSAAVATLAADVDELLVRAEETVRGTGRSPWYVFLGAFAILLREGVEATLIIAAILGLLRRAAPASPSLSRSVHLAWISALALGLLTWVAAQRFLRVGPGQREAAEGVISLLAAALLFAASYWLLRNREMARWMGFLKDKVERASHSSWGGAWSLFAVSFLSVYREVFETVLFLQALFLGAPEARLHAFAGIGAGVLALGVVVWVLFRVGARLPLKPFFALSSVLLALLSFVLAGEGVHALQQAGYLPAPGVALPSFPTLGFHPTIPGIAVQGTIALLFAFALLYSLVLAPLRARRRTAS